MISDYINNILPIYNSMSHKIYFILFVLILYEQSKLISVDQSSLMKRIHSQGI